MSDELIGEPYFFHRSLTSAGAATEDIETKRVKPGHILLVLQAKAVNKSNNFTRIDIGTVNLTIYQLLYGSASPSANVVYGLNNIFLVPEGEYIRFRFTGNTAADNYRVHVQGLLVELK